jgi:hypothetical protein
VEQFDDDLSQGGAGKYASSWALELDSQGRSLKSASRWLLELDESRWSRRRSHPSTPILGGEKNHSKIITVWKIL